MTQPEAPEPDGARRARYYKKMAHTCPACGVRPFDRCRDFSEGGGFLPFGSVHTERGRGL